MTSKVIRLKKITRAMVQADRSVLFVFGDNMARKGLGGQAREMRGEPNAIGVPTKWKPSRDPDAYFTDTCLHNADVQIRIQDAFAQLQSALHQGRDVVIPADGLGTGLAELPTRAPKIHALIESLIAGLTAA